MRVFITMQTGINPPVCISDVIIQNNNNNIYGAMLATVAGTTDPSRQQRRGIRYDRHGQLTGQELISSVPVCVRVTFKTQKKERGD